MWRYNTATNTSVSPNANHNNDCYCVGELMKSRVVCELLFGHACQVGWAKANRFEKKTGIIIVARCINVHLKGCMVVVFECWWCLNVFNLNVFNLNVFNLNVFNLNVFNLNVFNLNVFNL